MNSFVKKLSTQLAGGNLYFGSGRTSVAKEFVFGFTENLEGALGKIYISNPTMVTATVVVRTPRVTGTHRLDQCLQLPAGNTTVVTYTDMMTDTGLQDKS